MIRSAGQADKVGLDYLETERKIEKLKADRDKKIAEIKEKAKAELDPLEKKLKKNLEELGDFALTTDQRDPGTTGQITLTHVKLTLVERENLRYPSPLQKVIDKAKKLDLRQFIRTKEEVNKERIKSEASADQLSALGIKTETTKTAYVEAL